MSLVLRLPRQMHLCRSSSNAPRLPSFLEMLQNPHVLLTFHKVHNPLRLPRESTSERPKVVQTPGVLYILTSTCASRQNSVHFFNIATSKSGPKLVCFVHLTWKCASRQNGLHFSDIATSKSGPKLVCFVHLTWKCASRHNGVHFFDIATWESDPKLRCLVQFDFEMCFAPQRRALFRHRNLGK